MNCFIRAVCPTLAALLTAVWLAPGYAGAPKKTPARQELVERFDRLAPVARLQLVEAHVKAEKEFQPVTRDQVVATVLARVIGAGQGQRCILLCPTCW